MKHYFLLTLLFFFPFLSGNGFDDVPINYKGRFLPFQSYLKQENLSLDEVWEKYFETLKNHQLDNAYQTYLKKLKEQLLPEELALELEEKVPLASRMLENSLLKVLPGKNRLGEWFSLQTLGLRVYNHKTQKFQRIGNFTLYSNALFSSIRKTYLKMEKAYIANEMASFNQFRKQLSDFLKKGYEPLAGTLYSKAIDKQLYYPSNFQLKAEKFYAEVPFLTFSLIGYLVAFFLLTCCRSGWFFLLLSFALHSLLLGLRIYILWRPPVANMFETLLYVPWVTVAIGLLLRLTTKSLIPPLTASLAAAILLFLAQWNFNVWSLENVPAVLNSQYWLLIHVLMVVGSYGLFLLASFLGHFYIGGLAYFKEETASLKKIIDATILSLYIGTALLVTGTLLGGIWAAQSWGRFWDWDPKESWAFISICTYLLSIHAYRFGKIAHLGLAYGSILGFFSISFTWYGVNYILGTGLHSYGFGSGNSSYYYSFLFSEVIFLVAMRFILKNKNVDRKIDTC